MRNKTIVKFPTLNDKGGDVTKQWYVEYYYYVPNEAKPRKRRIYTGLCTGTAAERYEIAKLIIAEQTAILKSPDLFSARPHDTSDVHRDDEGTRPEADRYAAYEAATKAENLTAAFIDYMRGSIAQKTYETYKSKLKYYCRWLQTTENNIVAIRQQQLVPFFHWLADDRHLTKRSIFKYKQIVHGLYDWLINQGYLTDNPVYDIPAYGTIKDCAPVPMGTSDRERLKAAIENADPYLWLACEIQYYSAVRPDEIRNLKVRDLDLERLQITIRAEVAKNRHKETVPIKPVVADLIRRLGIMNYNPDYYVFGYRNIPSEKPVGKNTLRNRFNCYRDALHIDPAVKFYSWKHTGAISMVNGGVSVWDLQHHMRHSSVTTTEEYIRQRANQARRAQDYIEDI